MCHEAELPESMLPVKADTERPITISLLHPGCSRPGPLLSLAGKLSRLGYFDYQTRHSQPQLTQLLPHQHITVELLVSFADLGLRLHPLVST